MSCLVTIQVAGGVCQIVHMWERPTGRSGVFVVDWDNLVAGDPLPDIPEGVAFSEERDELLFDPQWVRRW